MPASAFAGGPCVCRHRIEVCDERCVRELVDVPSYFACLRLTGRRCVVVGGGPVALEKVEGLLACGADVTLVSPEAVADLAGLAEEGSIVWTRRGYLPQDLDGAFVVVAATDDTDLNVAVSQDADARGTLCNVADVPPLCSFILPAVVRNGPVAIAVSTSGASPALAQRMRDEIAAAFGEPYARLAEILNEVRGWAKATLPTYRSRKAFFDSVVHGTPDPVELLRTGDEAGLRELLERRRREASPD
ncbi:MAG TPA: bifunctional precorrin-2 dehydrogenase/sirohydrochlorin ferrochelatase [Actinomycetota bacterium]|nr:bifunctional precorrin-2 dehydrogenase/sirohydrochlorin ferrochelatase [Actinomycetota bacterium]